MNRTAPNGAMELRDYLAVLKRRRAQIFTTFAVMALVSIIIATVLPPVYRSTATILIERQEIPPELVETTVTGYVEERLQMISRKVLTDEVLLAIATEIGLYDPADPEQKPGSAIGSVRNNILLETQEVQTTNPTGGKKAMATVAFTLSFDSDEADRARMGADALTRLYLEQEQQARMAQAQEVSLFLGSQASALADQIAELERSLASFKQENAGQLPELTEVNMRLMEQVEAKIDGSRERLHALEQQRLQLKSQMATTSRYAAVYDEGKRVLSPEEQLAALRAQYFAASATYSDQHPDVDRMRREIAVLERQAGGGSEAQRLYEERDRLQARLADLGQRYAEAHPDVSRTRRNLEELERRLAKLPPPELSGAVRPPDNPAFISLETELASLESNIAAEKAKANELEKRRGGYEKRLFQTPEVERDYLRLSRDYQNAMDRYREVKDKQLEAQAAEQLEREQKAQRFLLVTPPVRPSAPYSPNRLAIVVIGFVFSLGSGIGAATVAEYMDRSVRGIRGITQVFGAPPLATIPYVENGMDVAQRRLGRVGLTVVIALLLTAALMGYRVWSDRAPADVIEQQQ